MININFVNLCLFCFREYSVQKITVKTVITVLTVLIRKNVSNKYSYYSFYSYFLRTIYGTPVEKISMDAALKK